MDTTKPDQPVIKVTDVAFPRFQAPDLDRMQAFLEAFGMQVAQRTADSLYMRGSGSDHHVHVTHLGDAAFLGLAFRAASRGDLVKLAVGTLLVVDALNGLLN